MNPDAILDIFRQAMFLCVTLVTVIVLPGLIVGLFVAMFQAATQINEMSLSFIPKLVITLVTLSFASSWILKSMLAFTTTLVTQIPNVIG